MSALWLCVIGSIVLYDRGAAFDDSDDFFLEEEEECWRLFLYLLSGDINAHPSTTSSSEEGLWSR